MITQVNPQSFSQCTVKDFISETPNFFSFDEPKIGKLKEQCQAWCRQHISTVVQIANLQQQQKIKKVIIGNHTF